MQDAVILMGAHQDASPGANQYLGDGQGTGNRNQDYQAKRHELDCSLVYRGDRFVEDGGQGSPATKKPVCRKARSFCGGGSGVGAEQEKRVTYPEGGGGR